MQQCSVLPGVHCWQTRFTSQWTNWQFLNHIFITFRRAQKVENCTDWHNANLTVESAQRCGAKMQILCHNNFSHFPNLNLYLTCILLSVAHCAMLLAVWFLIGPFISSCKLDTKLLKWINHFWAFCHVDKQSNNMHHNVEKTTPLYRNHLLSYLYK